MHYSRAKSEVFPTYHHAANNRSVNSIGDESFLSRLEESGQGSLNLLLVGSIKLLQKQDELAARLFLMGVKTLAVVTTQTTSPLCAAIRVPKEDTTALVKPSLVRDNVMAFYSI